MLPSRPWLAASAVAGALVLVACGSDGGPDADETGRRDRAVTVLRDYGLTEEQAECIADELGSETVVEAADVATLAAGRPYQDAAEACGR